MTQKISDVRETSYSQAGLAQRRIEDCAEEAKEKRRDRRRMRKPGRRVEQQLLCRSVTPGETGASHLVSGDVEKER
jgi:hypothetical protein